MPSRLTPAARGPVGYLPVAAPSPQAPTRTPPVATYFDLHVRRTIQNLDGTLDAMHPVDQRAVLLLGVAAGSFSSAPAVGHPFRTVIRSSADPALQAKAEAGVSAAWAALISAGDIEVLDVRAAGSGEGRVEIAATYANLRTGAVKTITR